MLGVFEEKVRKIIDRPVTLEALIQQPEISLNGTLSGIVTVKARGSSSGAANDGGNNSVSITKHGTAPHVRRSVPYRLCPMAQSNGLHRKCYFPSLLDNNHVTNGCLLVNCIAVRSGIVK